jgi:hypothetical protein
MEKPDHEPIKQLILKGREFLQAAFIVGAAREHTHSSSRTQKFYYIQ